MYSAVIFDFDGTICDTGEGVKKSAKYALDSFNIVSDPWETLDHFIGPPLLVTFQEKYGATASQAEELVKKYRERYTDIGVFESHLYNGIEKLLQNLRKEKIKIAIASSKPDKYIHILLEKFNVSQYFDAVCAVSFTKDCESKQSIISRALHELGVDAKDAVMVGDRLYDIDGANANGIDSIGASWGYGSKFEFIEYGAKYIADKPEDIESIVLGLYERCDSVHGIYSGRIITVHNDDVTLCDDTKAQRECVDHPGGVGVIGINKDDEVYLVRQFRYPYRETIYEIPAGKIDKGENPFEAGKREFREECGLIADKYEFLGEIYPTPGYTNEIIRIYLAENLHEVEQELDEGEFLNVCKFKFDKLLSMIMSGEIKDAKTIIAALKLNEMRNKQK